MVDWSNHAAYAKYSEFSVGDEASGFKLTVGGYSGTAGRTVICKLYCFSNILWNYFSKNNVEHLYLNWYFILLSNSILLNHMSDREHVSKFYGRLRLIFSVLSAFKMIKIGILWVRLLSFGNFCQFWNGMADG